MLTPKFNTLIVPKRDGVPKDYIPYRYCLNYIKQKSNALPYSGKGQDRRLMLMEMVGMKNYTKFYRRRMVWDKLKGSIPLAYFDGIGVDMKTLAFCLELDNEAYVNVLSMKRTIPYVEGLKNKFCCAILHTPKNCYKEKDAVEFFNGIMLDPESEYAYLSASFPKIITYRFRRGKGLTNTIYYYPKLVVGKGFLTAKNESIDAGLEYV